MGERHVISALRGLVVDPAHGEAGVRRVPGGAFVGMEHGAADEALADRRHRGLLGGGNLNQRAAAESKKCCAMSDRPDNDAQHFDRAREKVQALNRRWRLLHDAANETGKPPHTNASLGYTPTIHFAVTDLEQARMMSSGYR
jgi:hypothetical protein